MFRYCLHTAGTVSCSFQRQLGMEDGSIEDAQLAVSSRSHGDKAMHARLNKPQGVDDNGVTSYGAWCPHDNTLDDQWIRVDLGVSTLVAGVIMQGRSYKTNHPHFVSKYKVQYGNDDVTWQTVMDDEQENEMVRGIF